MPTVFFLYILPNLRLQFFSVTKPTMSKKRSVPTKRPLDTPKRPRKMLTIAAEKVKLLDMLKEGKSYAAVGRHYGINESSVRYIKKEENNIRTTAAISFNKDAKRVVTVRNKAIVRMESALALWINDCRKKSITLDTNVICTKAKKLYETFADSDVPHHSEGERDADPTTTHNDVLLSEKDPCAAYSRKRRYSAAESGRKGAVGGTVKYASDNVSYLVFIAI